MSTTVKFEWILNNTDNVKRGALIIPFYNEAGDAAYFEKRLDYYNKLAASHADYIDVILVDDGSQDDSVSLLKHYADNHACNLSLSSVWPNCHKVGAQQEVTRRVTHDYIIYSDFDTDLLHLEKLPETFIKLDENPDLMGCYFKMYPVEVPGIIVKFQIFEYALSRILYKRGENDNSVSVMPGAGCVYKRSVIERIFEVHSREVSGEDRETAMIGQELGYGAFYQREIHVETRCPGRYRDLLKQRVRWSLGFLENFFDTRKIFLKQLFSSSSLSSLSLNELLPVLVFFILPVVVLWTLIKPNIIGIALIGAYYLVELISTLVLVNKGKEDELGGFKHSFLWAFLYPVMRVCLEVPGWWMAFFTLIKKRIIVQ